MHHILAMYAASSPPPFKVAGNAVPSALGMVLHWIAKLLVILMGLLILALLKFRYGTPIWQLIIVLILGAVALPHTSQKVAKGVSTITSGSSVASTGASIGLIALMSGLLLITLIVVPMLRKRAAKAIGVEEEG